MGKVLAITNRKGGTGKTMTSVSLGASLARQGKKILIIDADKVIADLLRDWQQRQEETALGEST